MDEVFTSPGAVRPRRGWRAAKPAPVSLRKRFGQLAACVLAAATAYGIVFGHNGLTAYAKKRAQERNLEQQVQQLQQENARLQIHVERLATDPASIAHQAHDELHYSSPDEVIYKLPADPAPSASQ